MANFYVLEGPHLVSHGHTQDGMESAQAGPGQQVIVKDFTSIIPRTSLPFMGARWNVHTLVWDDLRSVEQKNSSKIMDVRLQRNKAYPPLADLADALVHQAMGNEEPMQVYLAACFKVKKDLPKPNME